MIDGHYSPEKQRHEEVNTRNIMRKILHIMAYIISINCLVLRLAVTLIQRFTGMQFDSFIGGSMEATIASSGVGATASMGSGLNSCANALILGSQNRAAGTWDQLLRLRLIQITGISPPGPGAF